MPDKILITRVDNPLQPENSPQVFRDWTPGLTARKIAEEYYPLAPPGAEVITAVNGKILDPQEVETLEIKPNDSMALWVDLQGGDGLRSIAFMVVAFAAALAAPMLVGAMGITAATTGIAALKYGLAVSAVQIGLTGLGSLVINGFLPAPVSETGVDPSPNYGWSPRVNQPEEGHALPELLGETRFAPPRIARHLILDGDRQYYYGLYALNGAELAGLSEVLLNGEIYTNFDNVDLDFRSGTDDQTVIDWFNDTWTINSIQAELDTGADEAPTMVDQTLSTSSWVNVATTESDVTEFSLNFVFAAMIGILLFEGNEHVGSFYGPETASFRIQWTDYADSGWANPTTEDWTFTGGGGLAGPARYATFTKDNLSSERWRIRVKLNSALNNSNTVDLYNMRETAPIDPTIRTTSGNTVERMQIGIVIPQGLYRQLDDGTLAEETVKIRVEYREVGGSGGWSGEDINDPGQDGIVDANNSPVRRVLDLKHLAAGPDQYQVKVYYREAPNSGERYHNTAYLDYIQEAVKDDFRYPGVALLAAKALATDALAGSVPRIEVIANRGEVESGKNSNNPAWAARYICLKRGRSVIEADFTAWASFCTSNNLECNIYMDETMTLDAALAHIGLAGRARVVPKGKSYGVIIDQAETRTQIFGDANTRNFSEDFLPDADLANSLEVTYWDEDLDYTPQTFELRAAGVDSGDLEVKKTLIQYKAVTSRAQAIALATITLNHTINTRRVISFEANADAIGVEPGQVFTWAGSRVNWGMTGRVVSSTSNTVTLDQDVTLEDGESYNILIRHQGTDDIEEKSIVVPGGGATTDTITISGTWTTNPAADAVFAFGKVGSDGKLFRVITIDSDQDQWHSITAAEYTSAD